MALGQKLFYVLYLTGRKQLCIIFINADFSSNVTGNIGLVPGKHNQPVHAKVGKHAYSSRTVLFDLIINDDMSGI